MCSHVSCSHVRVDSSRLDRDTHAHLYADFGWENRLHLMSCKQNYYMVSFWVIIKAIFNHRIIIAGHTHESHTRAHVYTVRTCKNTCSACNNVQMQTRQHACRPCTHTHRTYAHADMRLCVQNATRCVCIKNIRSFMCCIIHTTGHV